MAVNELENLTDQQVVKRALRGNRAARHELVRRYEKMIHKQLHLMVGNRQTAEDLAQKTFDRVFVKLEKYDPELPLIPWLITVARNVGASYLRRKKLETVPLPGAAMRDTGDVALRAFQVADGGITPSSRAVRSDIMEKIRKAVERLPVKEQDSFRYHYIEDRPYDEVAGIMKLTAPTIRQYAHRAKQKLRKVLTDLGI